ncbi:GNAT family N-acetyltransferase (plasmid) [Pseudoalteromonas sp. T1lg65]|uniref:GNAT family N-acetyltransferase n=1 Tax=Pseudoalteromonas sp. T1lg65 TaxID=2077101 RepID=UPI003F79EC05
MSENQFKIKTMSLDELAIAVEWAAQEGWNPGLEDVQNYYLADPNGLLIGYLGEKPIATISVVKYDNSFGFLGFYIVKPEYRGQGYGMQIWRAGLEYLKGCNVGLDGVLAQQENYKKSGFKLAYSNIRFAGVGGGEPDTTQPIVKLSHLSWSDIETYSEPFFPVSRSNFLKHWIAQPQSNALAIMDNGLISGYGVIRPCRSGYKIGPLYADSPEQAEALFIALKAKVEGTKPVFLDIPDTNLAALELAAKHNMKAEFETARMYTGDCPNIDLRRTYGVTSFEVG